MRKMIAAFCLLALPACSRRDGAPKVDVFALPFQLDGQSTFLNEPTDAVPRYFGECQSTPVDLPPEAANQRTFQMLRGILGLSQDPRDGHYVLKKLALFQAIHQDGHKDRRFTERIIDFAEKPIEDTA